MKTLSTMIRFQYSNGVLSCSSCRFVVIGKNNCHRLGKMHNMDVKDDQEVEIYLKAYEEVEKKHANLQLQAVYLDAFWKANSRRGFEALCFLIICTCFQYLDCFYNCQTKNV